MKLELYQIIVTALCLLFLIRAASGYLRDKRTTRELLANIIFWGGLGLFALFPGSFAKLTDFLGFKIYTNAIIFIALGITIYIIFKLILAMDNMNRQLTELVRKIALKEVQNNNNSQP